MADPNSPAVIFQNLLRTMLDGSSRTLTKRNVEDFRVILHMIIHECSKANIEVGSHESTVLLYVLKKSNDRLEKLGYLIIVIHLRTLLH
jgi:hypothetical protein